MIRPSDKPTHVSAAQGEVLLDGPDGVALSMTPDAAEETGRRLVKAAAVARGQMDGGERTASGSEDQPFPA